MDLTEKEIREQIKYHENEISKLRDLLPASMRTMNLEKLKKNDIFKLRARKIDSNFINKIEVLDKSHLFYDKIVVITGEFPSFSSRNKMAEMIQNVGGDVNTAISKKTDFVIVGLKAGPKKLEQIEQYQIKTFTEHEFIKLF